jgi:hypothetical protein
MAIQPQQKAINQMRNDLLVDLRAADYFRQESTLDQSNTRGAENK